MSAYLSIGDFSRASHLTVKTLRHYHQVGLLEPAVVDTQTGYRRYTTDQLVGAQVIRRLRELDMPLDDIHAVLSTSDPASRNERLGVHLARLQKDLGRTQRAVRALADLLSGDPSATIGQVQLRSTAAVSAAAISEVVSADHAVAWLQGALAELHGTLEAQRLPALGPPGGIYEDDVFMEHRGRATIFLPCGGRVRDVGRVRGQTIAEGEFAVLTHPGSPADVDRTYAALATYVARHSLAIDGPIREYYLVGQHDTADTAQWRTEIAWPVFLTTAPRSLGEQVASSTD